jgi:hypothetical protein
MDFAQFLSAQDEAIGLLTGETVNIIIEDIRAKRIIPLWTSKEV